jgi:guanidinoacetate N-methyltransferase
MNTVLSRKKIGFPNRRELWNRAKAAFDDHTLRIAGHPVMEDWEADYMDMLADIASSQGGLVLELGFGMGISARAIQKRKIKAHYVIECHPDVAKKCVEDFREEIGTGRLHLLTGFWQDITPLLADKSFDGILFDTYPLSEEEIHSNHFWFFKEASRLLKPNGVLTYYSDEATNYSQMHLDKLIEAGFKRDDIQSKICRVNPPPDCEYWQDNTLMAPVIRKY